MAVTITDEELDLFNKNGFTDDDVRATVENYRSQGLDDNAIRAKVQSKIDSWNTHQNVKQPINNTQGEVEEISTQPNLRLTGEVKKYNESANPVRNAIRQIGRNTARFILPKKIENWFLGSKEDEEFLKKYNDDNVMSYEDAATLYKQGLISKDEFMKNTGLRLKLDSLKADAEYRDVRNTNIGKGAVDIGTAAIPFGGGGKVATTVAGKLTPYLGKKIATEAAKGAVIGGKAGLAHGVGYGLVDEDINPFTQGLVEGGIGIVGGGLLGAGTGKLERTLRAKDIAKRRAIPLAERMTEEQLQNIKQPEIVQNVAEDVIEKPQDKYIGKKFFFGDKEDEIVEYLPQFDMYRGKNPDGLDWGATLYKKEDLDKYYLPEGYDFEKVKAEKDLIKQQKLEQKIAKENLEKQRIEEYNNLDGFGVDLSDMQLGKIRKTLNKQEVYNGELKTNKQAIKDLLSENAIPDIREYNGKKEYIMRYPNGNYITINKTKYGYAKYLQNKPIQQIDEVIPEQVIQPTGETKLRSLPQSVLEAKGTPKEVKEIIKQDMPTYQVLHNKDLTAQASDELAGNFDNELVRLASAKDFDALDYEKSRQIAKTLFDNGDYQRAVDLIDNVSENATKKGQAIQALSLWSNMTPEGAVYKAQKLVREYNKKYPKKQIQLTDENVETIANLQKEALNTTDELAKNQALARSAKYISELVPKNALQKLKAYRNIALLLNPKTLGRNIVGNALFNAIDTGAKALAVPIDRAIGLIPDNRFFNTVAKTRVAPSLKTYGKGLVEGAKTGYQEALQGIDTRGLGQRFDLSSGRTFQNKPMQALETVLDVGLRTPDRAFYEATFAESVDNIMRARGLTQPTQEILEQAEQEALEAVFQNQSKLSDAALKTRRALNTLGTNDFGLGDVLIPYAQTPANLAQQGINYSPFGAIKGIANLAQGNQRQASLDFARSLLGTGLIGGGYGLSKAGLMTPSQFDENYQTNKKIRENLQPLGIRPDQLGDMWYAPFQPMSIPLAVGNAAAYGKDPLQAGINTVVDLPFLQGISRGLRDLQEGNYAQAGINVASSIPSQFVPTLGSQFAQTIDPYQRETYDPNKLQYGLNTAIAKIPFASKTLPEKIDVTGQPIERYSTKGEQKLFDIFLNPTFINKKTTDPVLSELKYIYDQTKETSHFMPSVDKKLEFTDVDGNPQKIVLTGREFSEYQRRLGQRMYDEFNYVMDLPEYANTDEYGKIKILENAKKLVKAEVDNEMWNKRNRNKKRSYTGGN